MKTEPRAKAECPSCSVELLKSSIKRHQKTETCKAASFVKRMKDLGWVRVFIDVGLLSALKIPHEHEMCEYSSHYARERRVHATYAPAWVLAVKTLLDDSLGDDERNNRWSEKVHKRLNKTLRQELISTLQSEEQQMLVLTEMVLRHFGVFTIHEGAFKKALQKMVDEGINIKHEQRSEDHHPGSAQVGADDTSERDSDAVGRAGDHGREQGP